MTLYELRLILEGYAARKSQRRNELLFLAWHIEAFARQKRLPSLKKILENANKTKKKPGNNIEHLIQTAKTKGLLVPGKWR